MKNKCKYIDNMYMKFAFLHKFDSAKANDK